MSDISPITGVIDETSVLMDFGEYAGRTIRDIAELDPDFYQNLVQEQELGRYSIRRHPDKTFRLSERPSHA